MQGELHYFVVFALLPVMHKTPSFICSIILLYKERQIKKKNYTLYLKMEKKLKIVETGEI